MANMTPEKRAEIRQQVLERFLSMPPEERAQMIQHLKERIANMTPEERDQMRQIRMQGGCGGGMRGCRGMGRSVE